MLSADTSLNRLGWDMTFCDDFDGTNINYSKWNVNNYGTPANNELQAYTPDCVYVENSVLVLKSDRNYDPGKYWGREFISGKVDTAGHFAQKYGFWEVRALLPSGTGLWPAHWMLSYSGWPPEIDVMEMIGSVPNLIRMSVHWGPLPAGCVYPWDCGHTAGGDYWNGDMTWDYHTFAVEWDWWGAKFYIDGIERVGCYSGTPNEPMFFILNTAVGGNWPGYPYGTSFPRYHCIDYLHVWQRCNGRTLLNGGFEEVDNDRIYDWNTYDNGNVVRDPVSGNARSGGTAVKLYGRFTGVENWSGLYQDIYAGAGEMVEGSCWIMNRPGDTLQGSNTVQVKLEFLDSGLNPLSRHIFTAADSNSPTTYRQVQIREVAPANTARARLVCELTQRGDAAGAIDLDDAALTFVTPFTYRTLLTPGFESVYGNDFAVWHEINGNQIPETLTNNLYEGAKAIRFLEGSDGTGGVSMVYQDIPTREGESWTATVHARNRDGEPLTGSSYGFLRLEFSDENGAVLATNDLVTVTAAGPAGYSNFLLTGMAPAGAAFARILVGLIRDGVGGGSMVCDLADLTSLSSNATQLINRDFEMFDGTNYLSWTWYSGVPWNTQNDTANGRSGTNAVWLFGQFTGMSASNYSGIFQDLPAAQGEVWEASVWAQNRPGDALQGQNRGRLKLEFLDAAFTRIDYDQFSMITSNSPQYYEQVVIRRVAPTNTAYARIVCELKQINNANGSVNFDDADLRQLTVQDDRTLLNGGFEVGEESKFLNWSEYGNVLPNIVHEDVATNILEGAEALKIFGQFSGWPNKSGVFQDVPVTAGETWLASVWAKNRRGDALQGANTARLKLEFVSAVGERLETNALTILDAAAPDDQWRYFVIRQQAPYGAARARIVLEMNQFADAGGAVNFDNAALRLVTDSDPERALIDGGFEQGVQDEMGSWDRYGYAGVTNIFRDPVAANARSGGACLQMHGAYDGARNQSGIFQSIPAKAGELWDARVWARNRPGDGLTGSNTVTLKLEFIDQWNNLIQVKTQLILRAGSPTNYQEFALRDRAPWGTRLARGVIQIEQVDYAGGSINLDDAGLHVITAAEGADLANGNLEHFTGPNFLNWTAYGNGITNVIRDPQTNAMDGVGALQIWGEYSGSPAFAGLYQGVPAQQGQLWRATCWARNRPGDKLQGANQARLKLDFVNSAGGLIGQYVMPVVDAASPTNYRQHTLIAPAPADCAEVRVVLEIMQVGYQGGSANFDNIALDVLPALAGTQALARVMLAGPQYPGNLDAVCFTNDLVLHSTAQLNLEIGGTNNNARWDRLLAGGNCTLGGTLVVSLASAFATYVPRVGEHLEIIRATNVAAAFSAFNGPAGEGGSAALNLEVTATNVSVVVVRELDSDGDGLPDYWEQAHFGSLLGASAALDADGDAFNNLGEYISGTQPTSGASFFQVEPAGAARVLRWNAVSDRLYTVYCSTNLLYPGWEALATNLPATPALNTFTDSVHNSYPVFYRIKVRRP